MVGCNQGARKQKILLISGTILPLWKALELTIIKHRAEITTVEAQLKVARANL